MFIYQAPCLAYLIIDHGAFFFLAVTVFTVILNFVTATLITLRILYFNRYIRKTVGLERNSPYMTVIMLCVESWALIIVFSLIYLILFSYQRESSASPTLIHVYVSLYSFVRFCGQERKKLNSKFVQVLSPLLIIYRVAQGKAATIRQRPSGNGPVVSALYFEPSPLSSNKNEA